MILQNVNDYVVNITVINYYKYALHCMTKL